MRTFCNNGNKFCPHPSFSSLVANIGKIYGCTTFETNSAFSIYGSCILMCTLLNRVFKTI